MPPSTAPLPHGASDAIFNNAGTGLIPQTPDEVDPGRIPPRHLGQRAGRLQRAFRLPHHARAGIRRRADHQQRAALGPCAAAQASIGHTPTSKHAVTGITARSRWTGGPSISPAADRYRQRPDRHGAGDDQGRPAGRWLWSGSRAVMDVQVVADTGPAHGQPARGRQCTTSSRVMATNAALYRAR